MGFSAVGAQRHKGRLNFFLRFLALPMIPCANRRKSLEVPGYEEVFDPSSDWSIALFACMCCDWSE